MELHARLAAARETFAPRFESILYYALCLLLATDAIRVIVAVAARAPAWWQATFDSSVIVASALALVALGSIVLRRGAATGGLAFAIGAAIGLMFFARTLGFALVDPTSIGWLLADDWAQHYSGWAMFRHTPWAWPPGKMPEVLYPVGTSILYTDSLPLLAFALKPFSTWLSEPFQYIGFWFVLSFTLQGAFGALLITRFTTRPSVVLAGAALFVFAPVILHRIVHDTLTAQWLLLAAFCLYFRARRSRAMIGEIWPWWLLVAIALLVHPYLAAMVLVIQIAWSWKSVRIGGPLPLVTATASLIISLLVAAMLAWLAGAMTIRAADSSGGVPFGRYNMNLLSPINPLGFSGFLPTLPQLAGEYEGFAYFGIGGLALLGIVLFHRVRERGLRGIDRDWTPLVIVALALIVFAIGSVVAIGSWTPIDMPFQSRVLGLFRSSGRFVWVAYYALLLLAIVYVVRRFSPVVSATVLAGALVVQIIDLAAAHNRIAGIRLDGADAHVKAQLHDPAWAPLAVGRHHLTLLPPPGCGQADAKYLPMLLYAADHGLTANTGYVARWNARATAANCAVLARQLDRGAWNSDDVYVVGPTWKERFLRSAPTARCQTLDGLEACVLDPARPPPS